MAIIRSKINKNENLEPVLTVNESVKEDSSLRPKKFNEYIGQSEIKKNLSVSIQSAKKRQKPMDHVLIHGAAGLGKTTLANVIANEIGVNLKISSGPALEKPGDLASILTNLKANDILFIDEIHRLKPIVEEILYSAMEDFCIDLVLGKGPGARMMRMKVPKFTLIGATTKMSMLSSPLRDRFGHILKLNFYSNEEIKEILKRSSTILETKIEDDAAKLLALSSRQTPRIANRLLKRSFDFAIINNKEIINEEIVKDCLKNLDIDEIGLDITDKHILKTIIEKFKGGPVGLNTIAASIGEDEDTIEDAYEPYLIKIGFLERTPRGRIATENAYKHLQMKLELRTES